MNRARSAQRQCNRRGVHCCKALNLCRSTVFRLAAASRDLKQSYSKRTKRKAIALIRRSCSDSLLTARQMDEFSEARIFMQQMLTETEKLEIIEHEWAKARAKNPEVIMRVHVQDETDESGKPRVNVVIAFSGTWASIKKCPRKNSSNSKAL